MNSELLGVIIVIVGNAALFAVCAVISKILSAITDKILE